MTLTMRLNEVGRPDATTSHLNLRQLTTVQKVQPGQQVKMPDYLNLVSGTV